MPVRSEIDWRVPSSKAWAKSEHELQVAVVSRAMALASTHPEILFLHAIANGGWRGYGTGISLKAEGVLPGMPDLYLPVARGGFHGCYIELKKKGGSVSMDQWRCMEYLHSQGYFVRISNSLSITLEIITDYLNS